MGVWIRYGNENAVFTVGSKLRFQTIQEIAENSQMELRTIPKKAYQECFQKWQCPWEQCRRGVV
jgi:hypothetical protein